MTWEQVGKEFFTACTFPPIAQLSLNLTLILYRRPHLAFLLRRSDTRNFLPKLKKSPGKQGVLKGYPRLVLNRSTQSAQQQLQNFVTGICANYITQKLQLHGNPPVSSLRCFELYLSYFKHLEEYYVTIPGLKTPGES